MRQRIREVGLQREQATVGAGGERSEEGEGAGLGGEEDVVLGEGGVGGGGGEGIAVRVGRGGGGAGVGGEEGETFVGGGGAGEEGAGGRVGAQVEGAEGEEEETGVGPGIWREGREELAWGQEEECFAYFGVRIAEDAGCSRHRRRQCTAVCCPGGNRRRSLRWSASCGQRF